MEKETYFTVVCICNSEFSSEKYLKIHEKKKDFICIICDISCISKGDFDKHLNSVHEGKKSLRCGLYDSTFSVRCNSTKHIKSVH